MELKALHCKICGGTLKETADGKYKCEYNPAHVFKEKSIAEQNEQMLALFGEALCKQKEEQVANARYNLWSAVHEEYLSRTKINQCCAELKKLVPDDYQANFYEVANGRNLSRINKFLDKTDAAKESYCLDGVIEFMIKSLESRNVSSLKNLIERAYSDEAYTNYITRVEDEAVKLDKGIYEPSLPRDVFIAYSSADMAKVNEIAEYLESQGISCFVALRNLRHGRGAVEDYKKLLEKAMHNCKCVVFISSENSRNLACDALTIELSYIRENEPQLGRIEYLIQEYDQTSDAAKILLEDFFDGLEYCRTTDDLLRRILKYKTGGNKGVLKTNVQYCLACGEENPARAKLCMVCGSKEFVATHKEYLKYKEDQIKKTAQEELERRQRELEEELRQKFEAEYRKDLPAENKKPSAKPKPKIPKGYPTLENYDKTEFRIDGTVLIEYAVKDKNGEIKIPYGVTAIGEKVFQKCRGLTNIIIPEGVTEIGKSAFEGCNGLKSITIPESVTKISDYAFYNCENLASLGLPDSVTSIGRYAFYNCKRLTSIGIPDSVTLIGSCAFAGCEGLTSITIPANTVIGSDAFCGCSGLTAINVSEENKRYCSKNDCLIEKSTKTLVRGCNVSVIPGDGSVTKIGNSAFRDCHGLKSIRIPESVTSIGDYAFNGCKWLTSITIPNSVTSIGDYAFSGCKWLTSITIPNSVTSIGRYAFSYSGLEYIWISSDVTSIGNYAFEGCELLTSIAIPVSVESIGYYAFCGCKAIKKVTMPKKLKPYIKDAFGKEKKHIKFKFTK